MILKKISTCSADFFQNHFSKNYFRNAIRASNSLDPDQAQFVESDLGPNCLQRLSADNKSRQRVKTYCILLIKCTCIYKH